MILSGIAYALERNTYQCLELTKYDAFFSIFRLRILLRLIILCLVAVLLSISIIFHILFLAITLDGQVAILFANYS